MRFSKVVSVPPEDGVRPEAEVLVFISYVDFLKSGGCVVAEWVYSDTFKSQSLFPNDSGVVHNSLSRIYKTIESAQEFIIGYSVDDAISFLKNVNYK